MIALRTPYRAPAVKLGRKRRITPTAPFGCGREAGVNRAQPSTHLINGRARAPRVPNSNRTLKIRRVIHFVTSARSENAPYQYMYEVTSRPMRGRIGEA